MSHVSSAHVFRCVPHALCLHESVCVQRYIAGMLTQAEEWGWWWERLLSVRGSVRGSLTSDESLRPVGCVRILEGRSDPPEISCFLPNVLTFRSAHISSDTVFDPAPGKIVTYPRVPDPVSSASLAPLPALPDISVCRTRRSKTQSLAT